MSKDGRGDPLTQMLNANQKRRVGTHLGLLREDLENVLRWARTDRTAPIWLRIADVVRRVKREIDAVFSTFSIARDETIPLRRRVGAVAEVWLARVEDLRARRLVSHGTVHSDLAAQFDPHVDRIEALLDELARAAAELPEAPA